MTDPDPCRWCGNGQPHDAHEWIRERTAGVGYVKITERCRGLWPGHPSGDRPPANYAEQRALLDASLENVAEEGDRG
jgi:hypothetical protein